MQYAVMLRCAGDWRLVPGPAWERRLHTLTWCVCPTYEEAEATIQDLNPNLNREIRGCWIEKRDAQGARMQPWE